MFQDTTSTNQEVASANSAEPVRKKRGNPNLSNPLGRPKGIPNKFTTTLKEAILLAASAVGEDGKGKGELEGFLRKQAAKKDNGPFMSLLGKVLPLTIQGDKNNPLVHHVKVTLVKAERSEPKIINAKPVEQKR